MRGAAVRGFRWWLAITRRGAHLVCRRGRRTPSSPPSENADTIYNLTLFIGVLATIVGIAVAVLVVVVIKRFKTTDETYDDLPEQIHGHTAAELGWTIAPALLLVVVAVVSLPAIFELDDQDPDDMTILVEGQQWWWQFSYDLDNDGDYEIVTSNDIVIPSRSAGEPPRHLERRHPFVLGSSAERQEGRGPRSCPQLEDRRPRAR